MSLKANLTMKSNVDTLLRARHHTRQDLSRWCRKEESWASKILNSNNRWFPMPYWDRISDFFGVETYQLIQPGISALTERRRGERRVGQDRRLRNVAHAARDSVLSDRSLIHEVIALKDGDRVALVEMLAQMKRRGIEVPSTTVRPSVTGTDATTRGITPSGKPKGRAGQVAR